MSATAALAPPPPPGPLSQHASVLSLAPRSASPLSSRRTSGSPSSGSSKTPVPISVHQAPPQQSPPAVVKEPSTVQIQSMTSEDHQHKLASPAPVKLPEVNLSAAAPSVTPPLAQPVSTTSRSPSASPKNKNSITTLATEQAPAQLALLLSSALGDADALRRELASEQKRAARAERLLTALQAPTSPDFTSSDAELKNTDRRLPEGAAKAVVDAEARAEQAERVRDDALHALASLSASFAELERYEAACALRASDARGAYSRLLTSLTAAHPSPQISPSLSTTSPHEVPRLSLPQVPAPLPTLPPAGQLLGPGTSFAANHTSVQSSRHKRPLPLIPAHAPRSPIDARQPSAFDSLALPPPPSASGLGSTSVVVPSKRSYAYGNHVDESSYDEQKRRRLALSREMDIDMTGAEVQSPYGHRASSRQYQSGPPSAHPLSAQPTVTASFGGGLSPPPSSSSRIYDRAPYALPLAPSQSYHRDSAPSYAAPPSASGSRHPVYDERDRDYAGRERDGNSFGLVRVDARELVRDAKARERRERGRDSYVRHPHSQAHLQSQRDLPAGERVHRRSASRSTASSLSLDEMLLETATDRERGRPTPPEQSTGRLISRQSQSQSQSYGTPPSVNGVSSPYGILAPTIAKANSVHASTSNVNGIGRKSTVPAAQLMTLGPSGAVVSGGGGGDPSAAAAPVDPAVRYPGLRTCRQCGLPGRYKEGKCVEKWGPGPQGPGTVCDRCRKKMKRVERRGTLDSAAQASASASLRGRNSQSQVQNASHAPLSSAHSQSFTQSQLSYSQPQSQSQPSRARVTARTETLVLDPADRHPSDRARSGSPGPGSRGYHASVPAVSAAAARNNGNASVTNHSQQQPRYAPAQSQSQSAHGRRAPTPPYITSISSHEQYTGPHSRHAHAHGPPSSPAGHHRGTNGVAGRASRESSAEGENGLLEDDNKRGHGRLGSGYAHSYTRHSRDERDELEDDADGLVEPGREHDGEADVDADADGSGIGSADAEAEADADADIMDAVDATMKTED